MTDDFRHYAVRYNLDGARWTIDVMAVSEDDARRRIERAAAFGRVIGPMLFSIPIAPNWAVRLWQWLRK